MSLVLASLLRVNNFRHSIYFYSFNDIHVQWMIRIESVPYVMMERDRMESALEHAVSTLELRNGYVAR
ncbi:MAG: hypothetical protein KDC80_30615 [Saprospiraceae bacterium]|nr:hypothetical protein [Saprospiraceae bacterium]